MQCYVMPWCADAGRMRVARPGRTLAALLPDGLSSHAIEDRADLITTERLFVCFDVIIKLPG